MGLNSIYRESGASPWAVNTTVASSPPKILTCRVLPTNLNGLGGTNSVLGWVHRYMDEIECRQVKPMVKIVIDKATNVIFFQI